MIREVYKEILAHFLKTYILIQFTNAITATSARNGNKYECPMPFYKPSAPIFLSVGHIYSMEERIGFRATVNQFGNKFFWYESDAKPFGKEMWACDPNDFNEEDFLFIEVPLSYRGFVSNEKNLNRNRDCSQSCSDYTNTRQFICDDDSPCSGKNFVRKELLCHGRVQNCIKMEDDATACIAVSAIVFLIGKFNFFLI